MRSIFPSAILILALLGCQHKEQPVSSDDDKPPSYSTAEEAARSAKTDLLTVLRTQKNINLGLDETAVEKSTPGKPIKHYQVTFDELASADATTFGKARNEIATVVPLVAGNRVVTIVGTNRDAAGWSVASIVDKGISEDLNLLWGATASQAAVSIYDLPHSSVRVYAVSKAADSGEASALTFYTNYPGLNMQEGVEAERLLPLLQRDAAEFQRKHADEIAKQALVH